MRLCSFFGFALVLALAPWAGASAATIHLVIVADTLDPSIGKSVAVDRQKIEEAFADYVTVPGALRVTPLVGPSCRRETILATIAGLPVGGDDAVVVFYSGHGANDPRLGHYLQLPGTNGHLTRDELIRAIKAKGGRLGVLSTDCCNKSRTIPALPETKLQAPEQHPPRITALFRALFFDVAGFVDLTSSKPGEASIGHPALRDNDGSDYYGLGGLWTTALVCTFRTSNDRVRTWTDVTAESARFADAAFRRLVPDGLDNPADPAHPQRTQTAVARIGLRALRATAPDPPAPDAGLARLRDDVVPDFGPSPHRLGVHGFENDGAGIFVWATQPGTPAARIGLKRGDVVIALNDNPVRTAVGFQQALTHVSGAVRLTIREAATGATRARDVVLDKSESEVRGPGAAPIPPGRRPAFGVATSAVGGGLHVDGVAPDSPAALVGLDPGDVILAINGRPVATRSAFSDALSASPDEMSLTIRDIRSGKTRGLIVTLDRPVENLAATARGPAGDLLPGGDAARLVPGENLPAAGRMSLGVYGYDVGGRGLIVWATRPESPAARLGLKRGDVIVAVDGRRIVSVADVAAALAASPGESELTVRDVRTGVDGKSRVTLQPRPRFVPPGGSPGPGFGASVTAVAGGMRVDRTLAGSSAAASGLDPGDVITAVNGRPVADVDSFQRAVLASPVEMTFTVLNVRSGRTQGMVAPLD